MRTKKIIKTFDDYQLIDFSKDNQSINGIYLNQNFVRINLENNEVDIIKDRIDKKV